MNIPDLLPVPVVLVPVPVIEALANVAYKRVLANHPALFERLDTYRDRRFGFVPTDLPIAFVARPSQGKIEVSRKPLRQDSVDVSVEAPFGLLLQLLQGSADGDALFFSRDIQIAGDMEALLALRNSLGDARIDLAADVFGRGSPLSPLMRAVMQHLSVDRSEGARRWN